jgi:hypothetical protein
VHGELEAAAALRALIVQQLGWTVEIPQYQEVVSLSSL